MKNPRTRAMSMYAILLRDASRAVLWGPGFDRLLLLQADVSLNDVSVARSIGDLKRNRADMDE